MDALCAELACGRIGEEEKERLAVACEEFEKATKTKDATIIAKADVALHDIIVEATGNQRLVQLVNNLAEQMYRYRFEYIKDESQHEKLIEEHRMIYESIMEGNSAAAAEAARVHIDNQEQSIMEQIRLDNGRK